LAGKQTGLFMRLLFSRNQRQRDLISLMPLRIGSGPMFTLKAAVEFSEEEASLLNKYHLASAILVESDTGEDLRKAFRSALYLGIACYFILGIAIPLLPLPDRHDDLFASSSTFLMWLQLIPVGAGITLVMTFVYFSALREKLVVRDLMRNGRTFYCDTVVKLVEKEAYLTAIGQYLQHVLEASKTWGDRDVIEIKPLDPASTKAALLDRL